MQTVLIVVGIVVVIFFILFRMAKAKMKNIPAVADHAKIVTLGDKNFQQITKNKLTLVDFWAGWCAPCRIMAPVLNEIAAELPENAQIGKIDIEKYQSLAQKYKVRSIPTLILFKNGKEINRYVGVKTKSFLLKEFARVNGEA